MRLNAIPDQLCWSPLFDHVYGAIADPTRAGDPMAVTDEAAPPW